MEVLVFVGAGLFRRQLEYVRRFLPMTRDTLFPLTAVGSNGLGSVAMPGLTVWFTGLSSAGKTTIADTVGSNLALAGYKVELLDGDVVRERLSKGLGFSKEDRDENVRRIGFVAEVLTRNGVVVLVSAISPYRSVRNEVLAKIGNVIEVHVDAPLAVCEGRDLKGIYKKCREGLMHGVTGIDDPYEPPLNPGVVCYTATESLNESTAKVLYAVNVWYARQRKDKRWN